MGLLALAVVMHELGHVLAARAVAGDAPSVTLWPLGGLEFPDVPHDSNAYWWTAIAGPAMNLGLALAAAGGLAVMGFVAPVNPLASPFNPRLYNWREQKLYFSVANPGEAEIYYYQKPNAEPGTPHEQVKLTFQRNEDGRPYLVDATSPVEMAGDRTHYRHGPTGARLEPAALRRGPIILGQFFAVNWLLFLANLLPAFPLDGARLFQAWLWRRGDYRSAAATSAYVGFFVMLAVGIFAIAVNGLLPAVLAVVIYVNCGGQLLALVRTEDETPATNYDFSEGYTSLEREGPPPPVTPRRGWLRRRLAERAERRRERKAQTRLDEERRLDELLDKIHHHGRAALSDEELRFLTRVSGRYPNRNT